MSDISYDFYDDSQSQDDLRYSSEESEDGVSSPETKSLIEDAVADDSMDLVIDHRPKPVYIALSNEQFMAKAEDDVQHLTNFMPGLSANSIRILLNHFNWDREMLTERYLEDIDRVLKSCNLQIDADLSHCRLTGVNNVGEEMLCTVCYTSDMRHDSFVSNPACKCHFYCEDCYRQYAILKITTEGVADSIQCIDPKCTDLLASVFIESLINEHEKAKGMYTQFILDSIVEHNPQTRRCCTPACDTIFWVHDRIRAKHMRHQFELSEINRKLTSKKMRIVENTTEESQPQKPPKQENKKLSIISLQRPSGKKSKVKKAKMTAIEVSTKTRESPREYPETLQLHCTRCLENTCFNCGLTYHLPTTCNLLAMWMQKASDDSETFNWIQANTRQCPKCGVNIEKNQGCNHMVCRNGQCKHEFCWLCLKEWTPHGSSWFKCELIGEIDPEAEKKIAKASSSKNQLERYLYFFNLFDSHRQSLKFESKLRENCQKKISAVQQRFDINFIETTFLAAAAKTLCICRKTLMFAYSFGYYLASGTNELHSQLFVDNMNDLHLATEDLSFLLETDFGETEIAEQEIKKKLEEDREVEKLRRQLGGNVQRKTKSKDKFKKKNASKDEPEETKRRTVETREKFYDIKLKILNRERYLNDRREKMISHVIEGFTNSYWTYLDEEI